MLNNIHDVVNMIMSAIVTH